MAFDSSDYDLDPEIEIATQLALVAWHNGAVHTFYVGHPQTEAHRRGYVTGWVAGYFAKQAELDG